MVQNVRIRRVKRAVVAAASVIALLLVPVASAERRATSRERAAVLSAAVGGHHINAAQRPCVRVYISTVNGSWSGVDFLYPTPSACHEPANGIGLYHRARGHWRYVLGGSSFSCQIKGVPVRVAKDLLRRYWSPTNCFG